jgi:hypothetical protein
VGKQPELRDVRRLTMLGAFFHAMYSSRRGLFLLAGFEMGDSNSGGLWCGRQWKGPLGRYCLSNSYSILARRFGFDLPRSYTLGYGDDVKKAMERIVAELVRTLPTILEKVTLDDLEEIEGEEGGAQQIARGWAGPAYLAHVIVSEFRLPAVS